MSMKNRLERLEKQHPTSEGGIEYMKPSEILARADELIQDGATATDEERRAIEALRMVVHHEQP